MKKNDYEDNPKFRAVLKKYLSTKDPEVLLKELNTIITETSEDDIDEALVKDYLEVLRDKTSLDMSDYDAEKSFADFKARYALQYAEAISGSSKKRIPQKRFRVAGIIAAACLFFAILFIPQDAYGNNIFERIVHWGEEVLSISSLPPGGIMTLPADSGSEYRSMAEALEKNGISPANCPTWIPVGFALAEIIVNQNEFSQLIMAVYNNEEKEIRLFVHYDFSHSAVVSAEKDYGGSVYTLKGQEYYILENIGETKAAWVVDNATYQIVGDISIDDLYIMLDSL